MSNNESKKQKISTVDIKKESDYYIKFKKEMNEAREENFLVAVIGNYGSGKSSMINTWIKSEKKGKKLIIENKSYNEEDKDLSLLKNIVFQLHMNNYTKNFKSTIFRNIFAKSTIIILCIILTIFLNLYFINKNINFINLIIALLSIIFLVIIGWFLSKSKIKRIKIITKFLEVKLENIGTEFNVKQSFIEILCQEIINQRLKIINFEDLDRYEKSDIDTLSLIIEIKKYLELKKYNCMFIIPIHKNHVKKHSDLCKKFDDIIYINNLSTSYTLHNFFEKINLKIDTEKYSMVKYLFKEFKINTTDNRVMNNIINQINDFCKSNKLIVEDNLDKIYSLYFVLLKNDSEKFDYEIWDEIIHESEIREKYSDQNEEKKYREIDDDFKRSFSKSEYKEIVKKRNNNNKEETNLKIFLIEKESVKIQSKYEFAYNQKIDSGKYHSYCVVSNLDVIDEDALLVEKSIREIYNSNCNLTIEQMKKRKIVNKKLIEGIINEKDFEYLKNFKITDLLELLEVISDDHFQKIKGLDEIINNKNISNQVEQKINKENIKRIQSLNLSLSNELEKYDEPLIALQEIKEIEENIDNLMHAIEKKILAFYIRKFIDEEFLFHNLEIDKYPEIFLNDAIDFKVKELIFIGNKYIDVYYAYIKEELNFDWFLNINQNKKIFKEFINHMFITLNPNRFDFLNYIEKKEIFDKDEKIKINVISEMDALKLNYKINSFFVDQKEYEIELSELIIAIKNIDTNLLIDDLFEMKINLSIDCTNYNDELKGINEILLFLYFKNINQDIYNEIEEKISIEIQGLDVDKKERYKPLFKELILENNIEHNSKKINCFTSNEKQSITIKKNIERKKYEEYNN